MEQLILDSIDLLGLPAKDKVTGLKGVITSVSFDLYGCVQVVLNPAINKNGELVESIWFDTNRVKITGKERVMPVPPAFGQEKKEIKGPEAKPVPR